MELVIDFLACHGDLRVPDVLKRASRDEIKDQLKALQETRFVKTELYIAHLIDFQARELLSLKKAAILRGNKMYLVPDC
ncbi:hypothetical protein BVD23_03265 [Salmonella enterica]|nr:hypothetical protein [Salmonella enterica]EAN4944432.1 hypothetical protein [Salmonella enterica]EBI7616283.1 hypothetical protein [Salmonella enterica]EBI8097946.1 hypothetical protein [Salmonella enterica]EBK3005203.1 hypothetical protein [Salmonella enterica]